MCDRQATKCMLQAIINNPYRILGAVANAKRKELLANQSKIVAFAKVGQSVGFPLDLDGVLGSVGRSPERVQQALSELTLPVDQLRLALFWFVKATPADDVALGAVAAGDLNRAIEVLMPVQKLSAYHNLVVLNLLVKKVITASVMVDKLYQRQQEWLSLMLEGQMSPAGLDVRGLFIGELAKMPKLKASSAEFLQKVAERLPSWRPLLVDSLAGPLLQEMESLVGIAKSSVGKGSKARYDAGKQLMQAAAQKLKELHTMLGAGVQYDSLADRVGLAVLQCGIDYFNNSKDTDRSQKAMELQRWALGVVRGSIAKGRCEENVKILEQIIEREPPAELKQYADRLMKHLDSAVTAYENCCVGDGEGIPIALRLAQNANAEFEQMKTITTNRPKELKFCEEQSTLVGTVILSMLIGSVNTMQRQARSSYDIRQALVSALKGAWQATSIVDQWPLQESFRRERFNRNRQSLERLCDAIGISTQVGTIQSPNSTILCGLELSAEDPGERMMRDLALYQLRQAEIEKKIMESRKGCAAFFVLGIVVSITVLIISL